jgi:hypothetical protein
VTRLVLLAPLGFAACVGCMTDSEPYPTFAVADLAPIDAQSGPDIHGPLEVIGGPTQERRTVAAYHVHLPDATPRCIRILPLSGCDVPARPDDMYTECLEIRRVGDETHFFVRDLLVDGRRIAIDIGTASAGFPVYPDFPGFPEPPEGRGAYDDPVAIVEAIDPDGGLGERLACARFVPTPRR